VVKTVKFIKFNFLKIDMSGDLAEYRSIGSLLSVKIPSIVLDFIDSHYGEIRNAASFYPRLLESLPSDVPKPTFNEWMYYYNIRKLQLLIESQSDGMRILAERIRSCDDPSDRARLEKQYRKLEERQHLFLRDVLKYTSAGIDRETPKKIEVEHTSKIPVSEIHKIMRRHKKVIDVDYG